MRRGLKMLEIDETELKLLLEKRKKFINGSNFAEFGEIISGISLPITLLVTDCSKITFMPSLYFELIVWAITASILGHGIYRLIVSKKHSYSIKNLYDEVVDLDPKTEHSFNIVVFRNIHEKGKYLLFYSKRWQCWLFPNYRCQDGKFDENAEIKQIKANIKRDLKITDRMNVKYIGEKESRKFSYSDKVTKKFQFHFFEIDNGILPNNSESVFKLNGKKYCWKTMDQMYSNKSIIKKNQDVLDYVRGKCDIN